MKIKHVFVQLVCIVVMLLSACSNVATTVEPTKQAEAPTQAAQAPAQKTELLVYAGSGLKSAMEEIKKVFEQDQNVTINYVYAGSAQLLSQIQTSGKGDVFIVGSQSAYNTVKDKGLAEENQLVAHHTPIIAVPKGNPAKVTSLNDFTRSGLRVILGDPKSNAIGETAQQIFKKNKIEGVDKNVVNLTATVNEIVVALKAGNADAAIITKDGAVGNESFLDVIEIPADQNIDQIVPICVLKSTANHDMAQKFVDFVASEKGKAIFEKHGFEPYKQ